ncbi:immunoglobulin superfamily member 10-like isoform X1 [Watersipora subatra]|uniref:immunoglobulin superfamily member 10-like isoform X1 n=1 Tax=Watersipora subatra TaxID=2589382 RepID=UPI00355C8CEE
MGIYALLMICELILGISGRVQVELIAGGQVEQSEELDAKIGVEVEVKCNFENIPAPTVPGLYYKESSSRSLIFANGSELQQPWQNHQENYIKATGGDATAFFLSLTIKEIAMIDTGVYECILGDGQGNTLENDEVKISVAANVQKVTLEGVENGEYKVTISEFGNTITCKAFNGSKPDMFIRIDGGEEPETLEVKSDDTVYEGTILYMFKPEQDGKQIICEALVPGYEFDKVSDSAFLHFRAKPQVTCPRQVKSSSSTAKVTCTVEGDPLPNREDVTWVKRGGGHEFNADSSNEDLGYTSTIEEKNGKYVVTLEVTLLTTQDYGVYTLQATNEGGYSSDETDIVKANLTVSCPSEVKSNSGTAKVTCTVEGDPLPNKQDVTWVKRNGRHEFNADSSNGDLGYASTVKNGTYMYFVTLEVTILTTQDYGVYTL